MSLKYALIVCLIVVSTTAACNPTAEEQLPTVVEVEETELTTPEAEDSSPEAEVPPSVPEDDAYFFTVQRLSLEDEEEGLYTLDASISNQGGPVVTTELDDFALVDTDGNRYDPIETNFNPPLDGQELTENRTLRGFAQFILPDDVVISHAEWCVDEDCEILLGSVITQTVD